MNASIRFFLLALVLAGCAAAQQTPPQDHLVPVFALEPADSGPPQFFITPIFLLTGSGIRPLPDPCDANPRLRAIFVRYIKVGAQYTVVFGGAVMGDVTVSSPPIPPDFPTVKVNLRSRAPIQGSTMALAIGSSLPFRGPGTRRDPTSSERDHATLVAKSIFMARGVKPSDLSRMKVDQITVMPLNSDQPSILTSVGIEWPDDEAWQYSLFFIARENSAEADVLWYQQCKQVDEVQDLTFVDCIDTDGDGVDEIVVRRGFYEDVSYEVYKLKKGQWKKIFSTGVYGCVG